jgi:hypothetical protein
MEVAEVTKGGRARSPEVAAVAAWRSWREGGAAVHEQSERVEESRGREGEQSERSEARGTGWDEEAVERADKDEWGGRVAI